MPQPPARDFSFDVHYGDRHAHGEPDLPRPRWLGLLGVLRYEAVVLEVACFHSFIEQVFALDPRTPQNWWMPIDGERNSLFAGSQREAAFTFAIQVELPANRREGGRAPPFT
jgi:hypothetical protein